jgi:hypothetical protein
MSSPHLGNPDLEVREYGGRKREEEAVEFVLKVGRDIGELTGDALGKPESGWSVLRFARRGSHLLLLHPRAEKCRNWVQGLCAHNVYYRLAQNGTGTHPQWLF